MPNHPACTDVSIVPKQKVAEVQIGLMFVKSARQGAFIWQLV